MRGSNRMPSPFTSRWIDPLRKNKTVWIFKNQ
jgi:hypothetical protein